MCISCDTTHSGDCGSHRTRSTSISSFTFKLLQLHWHWGMDLIARKPLVSSLKPHNVWILFFFTHLWIPRVLQWEGDWKYCKIPMSTLSFFFSAMYMIHCLFTVKLRTAVALSGKSHVSMSYLHVSKGRGVKLHVMQNKLKSVFNWIC